MSSIQIGYFAKQFPKFFEGTSVGVGKGFAAKSMICQEAVLCETLPDPVAAATLSAPTFPITLFRLADAQGDSWHWRGGRTLEIQNLK